MRRRIWAGIAAGVVVAAAAAVVGVVTWDGDGDTAAATMREYPQGERPPAPPLAGELLSGDGTLDVADLRGQVVVVNIWGSWCPPCRAETDDLEQVYQETRDELGVEFVGINIQDLREQAISFTRGRMSYPSIYDYSFELGFGFDEPPAPVSPPATLVLDRDGGVAAAVYRVIGKVELEQLVQRVAAEEPADETGEPADEAAGERGVGSG